MLRQDLLDIICCPKCHGDLKYDVKETQTDGTLTCKACGKVYEVRDDIPILLVDEESESTS